MFKTDLPHVARGALCGGGRCEIRIRLACRVRSIFPVSSPTLSTSPSAIHTLRRASLLRRVGCFQQSDNVLQWPHSQRVAHKLGRKQNA
eukprot:SAG11_NODE_13619_length_647_cov_0.793796_2_plen_88_part_01